MTNNFEQIENFLDYPENTFYFLQIIKRRKENPEMENAQRVIRTFYIDSEICFKKYHDTIIKLCNDHNARAYINLNKRNYKKAERLRPELGELKTLIDFDFYRIYNEYTNN